MSEKDLGKTSDGRDRPSVGRRYFTRRNILISAVAVAAAILLAIGVLAVLFRTGVFDNYTKNQFRAKMADIGIVFDADVFRLSASPLALELHNASFNDRLSGQKLFFIRDARLKMTVLDLLAFRTSRDINIDSTEVTGAEVWVKFDENGRSNFANLKLVEDQAGSAVNFKYDSVNFSLSDTVVHFGDVSRKISGDAKNILFLISPIKGEVSAAPADLIDEPKRYNFDLTSRESNFVYDTNVVESISLRAIGIADSNGAELTSLELRTPIGESTLTGTLTDWAAPKYAFDIQSSVDLTQASSIFANGTSLVGVGNFKGKVTGEGENYHIEGEADAASLRAGGVYLKALNVAATVEGINSNYTANGTAIAQMLTFDDFRIDFLKMVGNVRGTGTDFRWVGELQAAAAKSGSLTIGGLYLSDALAEYKDNQLRAESGTGRARKFAIGDTEFGELTARNLRFSMANGVTNITAPNAGARSFSTKQYSLQGVTGRNVRVRNAPGRTDVDVDGIRSETFAVNGSKAKNVSADKFRFSALTRSTEVSATNLRSDRVDANGVHIDGIEAPLVNLENTSAQTVIYSDKLRVAKVDAGAAILGSLNIGGVRVTIRQGRVEVHSNDIDAGKIALKKTANLPSGGTLEAVRFEKPVYVLEPSGRYRATADMSLGGGALGSVSLGAATAKVDVTNDRAALDELTAAVMNGQLNGKAVIAFNSRSRSTFTGDFRDLDISKLLALYGGRVIPIVGQTTGDVDLTFNGTNFRTASGSLNGDIRANAGTADSALIPVNGRVNLSGVNGLFNVDLADLNSEKSKLSATGRFDLNDQNSDLKLALRSTDASEIDRLIRVLGVSPELERQLDSMQVQFAGNLNFDGTVTGNLSDPTVDGRAMLDSISLRGREIGSISTDILVSPLGVELRNGNLREPGIGGSAVFAVSIPNTGNNNISVNATLSGVNAGNLFAALPITLPERIRDLNGSTTGTVDIRGLPNEAQGEVNLEAAKGTIAGQTFDNLIVKAVFKGTLIDLERGEMQIGAGRLTAEGSYDRLSTAFNLDIRGKMIPVPLLVALLPQNDAIPVISGDVDFASLATGNADRTSTYNVNFSGTAPNVTVGENPLGPVTFKGITTNQILTADLTADLNGRPQVIAATVNLGDDNLPFNVATDFNQSPIEPFLAFIPQVKGMPITGTGTGRVEFGGNLSKLDDKGNRVYSAAALNGTAAFSQLALQIQETPLSAAEPILIKFSTSEINFEKARFSGGGSNMTITGTKALTADGVNNLSIDGRVNLNLLNLASKDIFFSGFADTAVRLAGPNSTARLSGTANIVNGSVATFLGSDRFTVERLAARVIFTTNQVEVDGATGYLGGGKFVASGGGLLDGLSIQAFRFSLDGNNVTVPLPKDFLTTGDAKLEISGRRETPASDLQLTIGGRVFAKRSLYSKDIDLANVVGARRDANLASGGGSVSAPRLDLIIEGRDALIVRNNVADLTASVSLILTGDASNPRLSGRITANSGTIFFRKDRYVVQRGVLEFPPNTAIDPIINLQAESEIAGYQIFVNLNGPLKDSEQLSATVRSSPALPQADVVSLITTGNLANTNGGIPTLAQTGINTAAEILTDSIINNPARKATDRLFGLNVFEIDPILSGQRLNPTARLTVGRQINNNLRVTYATNLSQDQNQVLALEYRVSNKLSFVAQYEQRPLSNVTRTRDNFSFEIRFRRRF
ncbi:MAG: translocation/assembly module TamB domain-containing protein [Pyrinomonadaceae bacterium]